MLRELDIPSGDSLNVGIGHKFHRPQFVTALDARGFALRGQWSDAVWQYGIFLFVHQS